MIRTFSTHKIRPQIDLNHLWQFTAGDAEPFQVSVPSCWETYPGFGSYRGTAVYSHELQAGGNLRLVFEGVSHTADVFIDGQKIAHHYNAFTSFDAVYPAAEEKTHLVEVRVSNAFSEQSALHIPNDYYSYGGISRPVSLEIVPDVFIEWIHMTPIFKEVRWDLAVEVSLRNISKTNHIANTEVTLEVGSHSFGSVEVPAESRKTLSAVIHCDNAVPYFPENPTLYYATVTLALDDGPICDDLIDRVGFREIKIAGKEILFNGQPIQIRGFCRHEDHPLFGCALPMSAMDQDLNLFRDLNANAVRTSHYPNDSLFLDLCDEKGFMVWEENHARGLSEEKMRNPNFEQQCEDCIAEMIRDHFNHPSIIIWGILNECASETEYGRSCYERQFAQIKSLDPSRPTSFASCKHFKDICLDLPDIVSFNIYPLWYHDRPVKEYLDELYSWIQETAGKGKPFLITEIGAGGIYGYRDANLDKWTEDYQAYALSQQIEGVLSKEGCSGIFIWQFCDVRVSREWFSTRPRSKNNKGVVDEYRRPKLAYQTVKEQYGKFKKD